MKGRPGGPFATLEATPAWQAYAAEFDKIWEHAGRDQFAPVDAFEKRELEPLRASSRFVFYPFSGPDVLYATHFFPEGKVYVFAGLERVGKFRTPDSYRDAALQRELDGWRTAMKSIFHRSFFVTSEMDRQFHGAVADGLMPMILLLLARSGFIIEDARYGHPNDQGEWVAGEPAAGQRPEAVEFRFRRNGEADSRKLYYFSTNVAGDLKPEPPFLKFVRRQGRSATLVKSASFLLHWQMCAALRQFILDNSNFILQDDTGIPYRFFQTPDWQVVLYGQYSPPDKPFKSEYQKDLAKAFEDPARVRELGFSLGYGSGRRPSSLMLMRRSQTAAAPAPSGKVQETAAASGR